MTEAPVRPPDEAAASHLENEPEAAGWRGQLHLRYTLERGKTVVRDRHEGPLRVLQPLYPEGPSVCHQVLVHPPGGIVGGDVLHVQADVASGAHALVTTPGATRFYRSDGAPALQQVQLRLGEGARLEWLPLETIAYSGCIVHNRLHARLQAGAMLMGWDVLVLGLPAATQPFDRGVFHQELDVAVHGTPGGWLERGSLRADDALLRRSPLGLAGHDVLGCMWFACAPSWPAALRDALLEAARGAASGGGPSLHVGATAVQPAVVVLRVLGHRVEPVMAHLQHVREAWRQLAWGLAPEPPRVWRT